MELKLDNLTKRFDDFTAVNDINLTLANGVYGLLGVNGAGKTTLIKAHMRKNLLRWEGYF